MLLVKWISGAWAGWTDHIPDSWLSEDCHLNNVVHESFGRGKFIACQCDVDTKDKITLIDYRGRQESDGLNFLPGAMRIIFEDDERSRVKSVGWQSPGDERFYSVPAIAVVSNFLDAEEGNPQLVKHLRRERDPFMIKLKKADARQKTGKLECEACGFDFESKYGDLGEGFCEVHHKLPINEGFRKTSISDLAILCSNCHRMIHRTKPLQDVMEFRIALSQHGS